jgi:HPt (histidine-containing phosphotransfer) domain-containing protein
VSALLSEVESELRPPLSSVESALSMLASGIVGELDPRAKCLVASARDDLERLTRVLDEVSDLRRAQTGTLRFALARRDVADLVREATGRVDERARAGGVRVRAVLSEGLTANADRGRAVAALARMLATAVSAARADTEVTVSARQIGTTVRIAVAPCGPSSEGLDSDIVRALIDGQRGTLGRQDDCAWIELPRPEEPSDADGDVEALIAAAIADVTEDLRSALPTLLGDLRARILQARTAGHVELLASARTIVHRLRGTAGTCGLSHLSVAAGTVEDLLRPAAAPPAWDEVDAAVTALAGVAAEC